MAKFSFRLLPCWQEVPPHRRGGLFLVTATALFLVGLALRYVRTHPDAWIYFPAYLIIIYLYQYSWGLFFCRGDRERFFVALGFSLTILRYVLLFGPLEPYLDILTVLSFYSFAYSQILVFEEPPQRRRLLNLVVLASSLFYLAMVVDYWVWKLMGPQPYLFDRNTLETKIGPVWLLSSLGLLLGFLFSTHLRAVRETDDFPIRLRLWCLIFSWFFFAAFFLRDEGIHFGWFLPNRRVYDFLLLISIIFTQLGLAMPRPVERFLTSLYFLDRRTSREITLFLLTWLVRHNTGSSLTELAINVAEELGYDRKTRQQVFLACEFLSLEYPPLAKAYPPYADETEKPAWENLTMEEIPVARRLSLYQQTVFKAWAIKRAVEEETFWTFSHHPGRLIAACRDYLLGKGPGLHDTQLWNTVEKVAQRLALSPSEGQKKNEGKKPSRSLRRVSLRAKNPFLP